MVSFEEVKEKLLNALREENVEPPVWLDAMVETIVDVIERYGGDVDCEVKRAVWALKEIRSDIETLKAEQSVNEAAEINDEDDVGELEYDEEEECMAECFAVCRDSDCYEDCEAGCI